MARSQRKMGLVGGLHGAGRRCELYRPSTAGWTVLEDGDAFLENRARSYTKWLRTKMEPAGGVMSAFYADASLVDVVAYGNRRDSAIWTGTYLAAESLRYLADGHPEALEHVEQTVQVLHRWFNISGDPGYLARYVAPAASPAPIQQIFSATDSEDHLNVSFEGGLWHWKGATSRDQYQGPLLGYSLAYEATSNEAIRELIRDDVVELVEQLMVVQPHDVNVVVNGVPLAALELDFQYTIFAPSDSSLGSPEIVVDTSDLGGTTIRGFQEFYPDLGQLVRQIPMLGWIPAIPRSSSAIMLASYLLVALQVTDGVPAYAARRDAIKAFYEANVSSWLDVAETWTYDNVCGAKYYGVHIAFEPMYNLARLEYDVARRERIRTALKSTMWDNGVADHKNVFFAYIYGANPPAGADVAGVLTFHSDQLRQFRTAPLTIENVDLSGTYPPDPECEGLSSVAIDVGVRPVKDIMWQSNPWHLRSVAEPNRTLTGLDYLVAYWMGRRHGFLPKDDTVECLRWH